MFLFVLPRFQDLYVSIDTDGTPFVGFDRAEVLAVIAALNRSVLSQFSRVVLPVAVVLIYPFAASSLFQGNHEALI